MNSTFPVTAILGLGLIGGSLARSLAAAGVRILGHDRKSEHLNAAVNEGIIQVGLGEGFQGIEEAEVVILAVPVSSAQKLLNKVGPQLRGARLVTDVGSTKMGIQAAAEKLGLNRRFVGAHPLAGSHQSGWTSSREHLFTHKLVYLCPTKESSQDAISLAQTMWEMTGARPEIVDATRHDALVAWTSHLPQGLSTALAVALAAHGVSRADLGRGGRDVTRLAGSSVAMWCEIFRENADEILLALEAVQAELCKLQAVLESGGEEDIRDFFIAGETWFRRRRTKKLT